MSLNTLLCILLYLGALVSPATYYDWEIDEIHAANSTEVERIYQNTQLRYRIEEEYSPMAAGIDIIDSNVED